MDIINQYEVISYKRYSKDKYTNELIHYDCTIYYMNKKRHRDNDQPAVIAVKGSQQWYINGKLHRDNDKPAFISADGSQTWWVDGKLHRDKDNPAIIYSNGRQEWWINHQFIRSTQ